MMSSLDLELAQFKLLKMIPTKFLDLKPSNDDLLKDLIDGFSKAQKSVPPKYFYDARGSHLFDLITDLEEYYPARTEIQMLHDFSDEISLKVGSKEVFLEPGSGSCTKAQILFDTLRPEIYIPIDISGEHLYISARQVTQKFPWLQVHAICADCTKEMYLPEEYSEMSKLAFFPGSSIGNFDQLEAIRFLKTIAKLIGDGGQLLIGVDLKKNKNILVPAYADKSGITASFNLNLLQRINTELKGNFNLSKWTHKAIYNEEIGRIEMHLISTCKQNVSIKDKHFIFEKDESIHTESSYKYSVEEFQSLGRQAGFEIDSVWVDSNKLFSLHLFKNNT